MEDREGMGETERAIRKSDEDISYNSFRRKLKTFWF